jgi:hypothetical protein
LLYYALDDSGASVRDEDEKEEREMTVRTRVKAGAFVWD